MSNFDKAVEIMGELATEYGQPGGDELFGLDEDAALALKENGLLAPDVQVIRTVEELEGLDPDTALTLYTWKEATIWEASFLQSRFEDDGYVPDLPAVVVATGAQVRAARKALEEENG